MKKFNIRPPVILALAFCAGITFSALLYFYRLNILLLTVILLPAIVIAAIAIRKRKITAGMILTVAAIFAILAGAIDCYYNIKRFDRAEIESGVEYEFCGKVIEKGITDYGKFAVLDSLTANGNKIDGKMNLYISGEYGEFFDVGYTVNFYGAPKISEPFQYGKLYFRAEENIKYSISLNGGLHSTYGFSLLGSIRSKLRDVLFDNLSAETAAVSLAMLTGNTQYVTDESLEIFRYGGIAHIFAVSGLHIGIIFGIVSFLFKKFRLNKYVSAVFCIGIILFYSAICGFTLSSVRAVIMCAAATVSRLFLQKNDGLNSLSSAAVLILIITPLSLFSIGFQLSILATAGIFSFSKFISKDLEKIKVPQKISSAAGISLGAQLSTTPVMLANFGYLSGAGILLNIIVVPILSVVYLIIFISSIICALIPPLAPYIMPYAALPLEFFMSVFLLAGFKKALISGFGAGIFVPIYLIGALALSDKLNLKLLGRIVCIACTAAILISYVLISYNYPFNGYALTVSAYGKGGEVLIKSPYGNVLVVTDDVNSSSLQNMLNRKYCNSLDALIILGDATCYGRLDIDCKEIYLNERDAAVQPYGETVLKYESRFSVCGTECNFCDDKTLLIKINGVSVGICADGHFSLPDCNILISDTKNVFINCETEIYFNERYGGLNVFDCGDINMRIKDGKFTIKNLLPPRN